MAERYDDYSLIGHSDVPEASLNYEPIDERFTVRASVGRSFGAPELAELFGPPISGPIPPFIYQGYYGNVASSAGFTGIGGPNPSLQPFTANTWSTGFVLAPREVQGLDLDFDFFDTTVNGAIGQDQSYKIAAFDIHFQRLIASAGQLVVLTSRGCAGREREGRQAHRQKPSNMKPPMQANPNGAENDLPNSLNVTF